MSSLCLAPSLGMSLAQSFLFNFIVLFCTIPIMKWLDVIMFINLLWNTLRFWYFFSFFFFFPPFLLVKIYLVKISIKFHYNNSSIFKCSVDYMFLSVLRQDLAVRLKLTSKLPLYCFNFYLNAGIIYMHHQNDIPLCNSPKHSHNSEI
jgi:hypothetical protein